MASASMKITISEWTKTNLYIVSIQEVKYLQIHGRTENTNGKLFKKDAENWMN